MSMNQWTIAGNVGQDPESRTLKNGENQATCTLALSEGENKTTWVKLVFWKNMHDRAMQFVRKGSNITVSGRLELEEWTDKAGKPRITPICHVTTLHLGGKPADSLI